MSRRTISHFESAANTKSRFIALGTWPASLCWSWLALLLTFLLVLGPSGCSKRPKQVYRPGTPATQRPYKVRGKTYYPLPSAIGYSEVGYASWYGPGFHGRKTANGERYDMHAMTAAHKILPMNTLVLVTNLENGRQAVVRINDRGPFVKDRIIDLSYAAAKKLGVIGPGVAKVRLTALAEGSVQGGRVVWKKAPPNLRRGLYYVQVGAFAKRKNAYRLRDRLSERYGKVRVVKAVIGGKTFWRVQVKAPSRLADAKRFEQRLEKAGFPQAFLVAL